MSKKTQQTMLKALGGTLAVCSAVAFAGSKKDNMIIPKKTMKNAVDKVADFVDTVTSMMYPRQPSRLRRLLLFFTPPGLTFSGASFIISA